MRAWGAMRCWRDPDSAGSGRRGRAIKRTRPPRFTLYQGRIGAGTGSSSTIPPSNLMDHTGNGPVRPDEGESLMKHGSLLRLVLALASVASWPGLASAAPTVPCSVSWAAPTTDSGPRERSGAPAAHPPQSDDV